MLVKVLFGFIALLLAVVPAVAQEVREQTSELTEGDGDVATSAFTPIPTGYTVIYFYTGARTSTVVSTSVHCSNLLGVSTTVRVEVYDFTGLPAGVNSIAVPQYNTKTFLIGPQAFLYVYDLLITPPNPVDQGIIRILKKGTGRIICAAQIHDLSNPPNFVLPLVQYGPTGLH